jgi:hypothetical protein
MAVNTCETCSAPVDPTDNFCRQCGDQLISGNVPVVIPPQERSLLIRQDVPPVLMKTAAAVAAGTMLQIAGRALLNAMTRRAAAAPVTRAVAKRPPATVIETVYVRRTHLRLE